MKAMKMEIVGRNMDTINDVEGILREHGALLQVGYVIPYKSISRIIGEPKHSQRWISVITQLKKRVFQNRNFYLKAEINEGYRVLSSSQRIKESGDLLKHGMKRIRKGGVVAAKTDAEGLTSEELATREHICNTNAAIYGHIAMLKKSKAICQVKE